MGSTDCLLLCLLKCELRWRLDDLRDLTLTLICLRVKGVLLSSCRRRRVLCIQVSCERLSRMFVGWLLLPNWTTSPAAGFSFTKESTFLPKTHLNSLNKFSIHLFLYWRADGAAVMSRTLVFMNKLQIQIQF